MLIKQGSNGEEVRKLKAKPGLTADGDFGPISRAKVKDWQASSGKLPNGVVDDAMWNKLFGAGMSENAQAISSALQIDKLTGKIPVVVLSQIPETSEPLVLPTALCILMSSIIN